MKAAKQNCVVLLSQAGSRRLIRPHVQFYARLAHLFRFWTRRASQPKRCKQFGSGLFVKSLCKFGTSRRRFSSPYRPFNTPPLYARMMRLILLLSALLSAFAAGVSPARAAGVSAAQVSALVERHAARAAVVASGRRPLVSLPSVHDVLVAQVVEIAPLTSVPLYAGRLRT
jgi:hypothetical protein